jgi:hypothetical protein
MRAVLAINVRIILEVSGVVPPKGPMLNVASTRPFHPMDAETRSDILALKRSRH